MAGKFNQDRAEAIVQRNALLAAGAGVADPTPGGFDVPIMIGLWATMLFELADVYHVQFDKKAFKIVAKSALKAALLFLVGSKTFTTILKYTGIFTLPAVLANGALNYGFTLAVGKLYMGAWQEGWTPTEADLNRVLEDIAKGKA